MLPVCVRSRHESMGYSFLRPPASGVALQAVRGPETRSAQAYSPKCLEGVFSEVGPREVFELATLGDAMTFAGWHHADRKG